MCLFRQSPGDTILIAWHANDPDGEHGVDQLRWDASGPCDFAGSYTIAQPSFGPNRAYFTFGFEGNVTFADPVGDHCLRGNYLEVHVYSKQSNPAWC